MFSWFKPKPKEHWRLVRTMVDSVTDSSGIKPREGKIYYHLHESNRGNRKVVYACSFAEIDPAKAEQVGKRFDTYQEKIYRWEQGRVDPEIPTYNQIPEEETANVLKGKVS